MLAIILAIEDEDQRREVEQWYITYYKMMRKIAYDIVQDLDLAEDMVNSAFIRIIKNYEKIYSLDCYKRVDYFVKTIKSVSIDYLRKNNKMKELPYDEEVANDVHKVTRDTDITHNPEERYINEEDIEAVADAMEQLSDRDAIVIWAKYFMEMSNKEIESNFGIDAKQVHVIARRAREKLVKILSGDENNEKKKEAGSF